MKNNPYNKGDVIKINLSYKKNEIPFLATILDVTNFYGYYETIAYRRMDNNECSLCGANYIVEIKSPIPSQAPINEYTGEQR